jgi:Tannase and feruloyl esterase
MSRHRLRLSSSSRLTSTGLALAGSLLTTTVFGASPAFATTPCTGLASLSIPNTTITGLTMVPASGSTPAFCNVTATVAPQTDIRVQLPTNWKGRYLHLGGAGFDGRIPTTAPASNNVNLLAEGYAIGASNGGHRAAQFPGATFAGDQELVLAYAFTAIGDTDTVAQALIQAFYGRPASFRYFDGCSNGGKNASVAASKFRENYDGVIGGDGVWGHADEHVGGGDMAGLTAVWARVVNVTNTVNMATFPAKLTALYNAEVAKCDALDGLADGIISNPRACHFDPAALACPAGLDTPACLTPTEVAAVKTLQSDLLLDNRVIGGPYGLGNLVSGLSAVLGGGQALGQGFLAMAFNNPTFMISSFDLQRDFGFLSKQFGKVDDMSGPLQGVAKYVREGGKLIVWTGGEDPLVPTADSVRFVDRLRDVVDDRGSDNVRLYTLPGVNHCGGGPGADAIDLVTPITNWVETGVPPKDLIASKLTATGTVAFTRPLCPFPQFPKYTGGNTNSASSFTCVEPDDDDRRVGSAQ